MSRNLKSIAARVARSLRREPSDQTDIDTQRVRRMAPFEPASDEVTQPYAERRGYKRRRVPRASSNEPTVPELPYFGGRRADHQAPMPAYLAPRPEEIPAPWRKPRTRRRRGALAGQLMETFDQPAVIEPDSVRSESVHTRVTRPHDVPADVLLRLGAGDDS
ncbi:MAG: hypothetical protein KJO07_04410 [Deltaproteobacteria bacterium]|jgi:hypothetical protein|nr:hypothetical protein [Deltaproteobacteria bacterium]